MTTTTTARVANAKMTAVAAAIAKNDALLESSAGEAQKLIDIVADLVKPCVRLATADKATSADKAKAVADWDWLAVDFVSSYQKARDITNESALRHWNRVYTAALKTFDGRKPQTDEAGAKQASRQVKEVENLAAALVSGIGAVDAEKKIEKMKKAGGATAEVAKRIEAQCKTAIEARREAEQAKGNSRKVCEAFALVAALCKLTKEQQARWDEAKAHLAS